MNYRNLTNPEILALENQGCRCEDWQSVQMAETPRPFSKRAWP